MILKFFIEKNFFWTFVKCLSIDFDIVTKELYWN